MKNFSTWYKCRENNIHHQIRHHLFPTNSVLSQHAMLWRIIVISKLLILFLNKDTLWIKPVICIDLIEYYIVYIQKTLCVLAFWCQKKLFLWILFMKLTNLIYDIICLNIICDVPFRYWDGHWSLYTITLLLSPFIQFHSNIVVLLS